MKKQNIAFAISKSIVGGAQTWVKDQINVVLESNKFNEIHLIVASHGWLTENLPSCIIFHIIPEIEKKMSYVAISKIKSIYRNNNISTLISSSANAGMYCRLAGFNHPSIKQTYVTHGWSAIYNGGKFKKFYVLVEKILGNYFSDKVLCVSNCDADKAKTEIGIKANKILTIRNSINYSSSTMPQKASKRSNKLKLLFVGRIAKPKRHDLVIDIVSTLDDICSLDIIGAGNELSLPDHCKNIQLIGEVESFSGYQHYDALILISDSEGLPMVTLEAGSNALPMILSNVGGCPEVIGHNGILVNNDIQSIRDAIVELHGNYQKYSEAAINSKNHFNIDSYKNDYIQLYLNCY